MLELPDFPHHHLRHVREADLGALHQRLNQLGLRGAFLPCALVSEHRLRQDFREHGLVSERHERLLLVDGEDRLLGTLWHFQSVPYFDAREIGYTLFDTGARRRGLMTAAVRTLVDHLFQSRPLNRLDIRMDTRNIASERVAQKNGFQFEGTARGANFVRGVHVDMKGYALLRAEWQAAREGRPPVPPG